MTSQEKLITDILNTSKYNIYHDKELKQKLEEIKNLGNIQKYQTWKKLIAHLCSARYNIIYGNITYADLLINMLDDKFMLQDIEYERIYNGILSHSYNDTTNTYLDNLIIKLCERYGIYSKLNCLRLVKINYNTPIKNFSKYIIDYLNNIKKKEENTYNNKIDESNILMFIYDEVLYTNIFYNNDNKLNNDNVTKFIEKFNILYDLELFYNISYFIDFVEEIMKKRKTNDCINRFFTRYFDFSKIILDKCIDNITNDTDNNEYLMIYKQIFKLKHDTYLKEDYKLTNKNITIKINLNKINSDIEYFETKLKQKLPYLYSKYYNYIDKQYFNDNYILIEDLDKDINTNSESYNKTKICDFAIFVKYILKLYENKRELLNEQNIDNFIRLKHYSQFIDLQNEKERKIIRKFFNTKILNGKGDQIDLNNLLQIGFDDITLKNAMYRQEYDIIEFMLNNKYNASVYDLLHIYTSFTEYLNLLSPRIKSILELYASYNIFMDKYILSEFIKNNDFTIEFKYVSLKPFTIYKDDTDKDFNNIIIEILEKTKFKYEDRYLSHNNFHFHDMIDYTNKLELEKKQISLDDIFKFTNHTVKFLLNKYLEKKKKIYVKNDVIDKKDNNENKVDNDKPKKIIKKVVKKVIKKAQ